MDGRTTWRLMLAWSWVSFQSEPLLKPEVSLE